MITIVSEARGLQSTVEMSRARARDAVSGRMLYQTLRRTNLESPSSEEGYSDPLQIHDKALQEGRYFACFLSPYWEAAAVLK